MLTFYDYFLLLSCYCICALLLADGGVQTISNEKKVITDQLLFGDVRLLLLVTLVPMVFCRSLTHGVSSSVLFAPRIAFIIWYIPHRNITPCL